MLSRFGQLVSGSLESKLHESSSTSFTVSTNYVRSNLSGCGSNTEELIETPRRSTFLMINHN
jgi:hypothetical protein